MSQSEVEQLLASVGGSDAMETRPGEGAPSGQSLVTRHEFPQLASFSVSEMRNLRLRCQSFVNSVAARLSVHLRLECALQMTRLEAVRFQPLVAGLPQPVYLTLFRTEPMEHICLLDIPVHLALAIVDRELGGPAVCQEEVRDLTQIEGKLAARLVHLILAEWCNAWADLFPMRPLLLRHETSGRFLSFCPSETMFLTLGMEARIAQTVETIQIAFPQSVMEPLVAKLNADLQGDQKPRTARSGANPRWNPALNDAPVQISARWRNVEISARELAALQPGALLRLRPDATRRVEVSLDNQPKFTGQLGTAGRQLAVKIAGPLQT
jgi:flagellar motor switch protein FliM